jgi:hypothetical protein
VLVGVGDDPRQALDGVVAREPSALAPGIERISGLLWGGPLPLVR